MRVDFRTIEYLGINVKNGILLEEKVYYHWNEKYNPLPRDLSEYLFPFDVGIRNNGKDWSYSCFIAKARSDDIAFLVDYLANKIGIRIDREDFCARFFDVGDFLQGSHYDPIISFKYADSLLTGVSFYVTALREKDKMNEYLESVFRNLDFYEYQEEKLFIQKMVCLKYADMFQVSWDFTKEGLYQNKVYLKIKDRESFTNEFAVCYPDLLGFIHRDGFRFCEFAFVMGAGSHSKFNFYFKPL